MSYEYVFKYLVIGEIGVGKSSLLLRFSGNNFDQNYGPTVGVEFISQVS
jgi:GTPase SAR1 family protein